MQLALEALITENAAQQAELDALDTLYEPIITGTTAADLWNGAKGWTPATALPLTTAQIAVDAGQQTQIDANAAAIAAIPAGEPPIPLGTAGQYWNGLKAWTALPVPTPAEPPITVGLATQVWQGDKTWVLKTALPITTAQAAVDTAQDAVIAGKLTQAQADLLYEPIIALGLAGQYLDGAAKAWVTLPAGAVPPVADQVSITGAGVAGDPFTVALIDGGTY